MNFTNGKNKIQNSIDLRKVGEETPTITHIPTNWDDSDLGDFQHNYVPEHKMNLVSKLFFLSLTVFLLVISFVIFNFSKNSNSFSQNNIDLILTPPASLAGGEENSIPIQVINRNLVPLFATYLILSYDSEQNISSASSSLITKRIDLGDLISNDTVNNSVDLILYGNQGDIKKIKTAFYYSLAGSKVVYSKDLLPFEILIKSSPVTLTVNSFKEMHVNTNYTFDIFVKNNTDNDIQNLIVSLRPPNDFVYASSSLPLYNKNPSWMINNLARGSQTKISLIGKLVGTIGTNETFTFYAGPSLTNIFSQISKSILSASQYIDVKISESSFAKANNISVGDTLYLEFVYKNNLNFPLENLVLIAKLEGQMLDKINTRAIEGNFDQINSLAIWDKNTKSELAQIEPGGTGKVILNLKVSQNFIPNTNIKLQILAKADRNAEDSVPNDQDISLERVWNVTN